MTKHNIKVGDEFVVVNDNKGGFSLIPKNSGSDGGGAGCLIILLILFVLLIALALIPFILAISSFFVKDKLVSKLRWFSILIYIGMILSIYVVFPLNSDLKEISDGILAYKRLFIFGLLFNGLGVLSAVAGISQKIPNLLNYRVTLFSSVCYLIFTIIFSWDYMFGNKIDFTKEQLSKACECYENSYEQTGIRGDDLSKSDLKIRIDCFELFKPEDFKLLEDNSDQVYERMKEACEQSNPNTRNGKVPPKKKNDDRNVELNISDSQVKGSSFLKFRQQYIIVPKEIVFNGGYIVNPSKGFNYSDSLIIISESPNIKRTYFIPKGSRYETKDGISMRSTEGYGQHEAKRNIFLSIDGDGYSQIKASKSQYWQLTRTGIGDQIIVKGVDVQYDKNNIEYGLYFIQNNQTAFDNYKLKDIKEEAFVNQKTFDIIFNLK